MRFWEIEILVVTIVSLGYVVFHTFADSDDYE